MYQALYVILPVLVAACVMRFYGRVAWTAGAGRIGGLALAAGYMAGYAALVPRAVFHPTSHWHLMPYVAVSAALAGGALGGWPRSGRKLGWLLALVTASVGAWLLVPTWPDLRSVAVPYTLALAAYFLVLTCAIQPIAEDVPARTFVVCLLIVTTAQSIAIAVCISLLLAQLNLITAAVLFGCVLGLGGRNAPTHHGMTLGWVVINGGGAFVAAINPEPPLFALMLFTAAPLALWSTRIPKMKRLGGRAQAGFQIASIFVPVATLLVWLLID